MSVVSNRIKTAVCTAAVASLLVGVTLVRNSRIRRSSVRSESPTSASTLPPTQVRTSSPVCIKPSDPSAKVSSTAPAMFHLDPARTNRSAFLGPSDPIIRWAFDAGSAIETAPAFTADGTAVIGTLGGKIVGVSRDGTAAFSVDLRERIYASPLTNAEMIFTGSDAHQFLALSSKGALRWRLDTDGEVDTSPVVAPNGTIVVAAGRVVYGVRSDGGVAWRFRAGHKIYGSPAIAADGTAYVGSQDNHLYAIDSTGHMRFAVDLGSDVDCAPAVDDDGTVVVGVDDNAVVSIEPARGTIRWRAVLGGHVRGGLTITRNHDVIAGIYGPTPAVVRMDGSTGKIQWRHVVPGTGASEFGVHGSPVEDARGDLYFGAQDDVIYSLSAAGELRWRFQTGADVDAPVVLAPSNLLYAASDDGKLYCIGDRGAESGVR